MARTSWLPATVALACSLPATAAVTFLGGTTLDGADRSGLSATLEDGVTSTAKTGALSAIAWTGQGNAYLMLPDRGPNAVAYPRGELVDNTQSFINRVHTVMVSVSEDLQHRWHVDAALAATTLLNSATPLTRPAADYPERHFFSGLSSGIDSAVPSNSMRLDSEALRVASDGRHFFVSDEYGPFLYDFDRHTGQRIRSLRMPSGFVPLRPAATGANELANNLSGRVPNKGMEGLAISPDGGTLFGLMQAPLLQDHAINPADGVSAVGTNVRLLSFDLERCSGGEVAVCPVRQYVYQLSSPAHSNSEILAVNNHQFLVIERDAQAGDAATKLITLIDIAGATDVTAIPQLPRTELPSGVVPVAKRTLFDLAAALKAAGQPVVEKYEGLAFGPDLPDGRHLLLVCVDNDFVRDAPNRLYAFAIDAMDLPGFEQQHFATGK
jgi:hypothetical protein